MTENTDKEAQYKPNLHLVLQRLLAEKLEKSYKNVTVEGFENISAAKRIALFLYNHQSEYDTASMARISNLANRRLINLVRPGDKLIKHLLQKANPLSHIIYTDQSVPDPEERLQRNLASFRTLASRLAMLPTASVSIAPDGGRSSHDILPEMVSTRGIQMLEKSLKALQLDAQLAILPVGLAYLNDSATIKVGTDIYPKVKTYTEGLDALGDNATGIKVLNQEFKSVIADSINTLIGE